MNSLPDLAPARLQRGEGAIHVGTATLRAIAEVAGGAVEQRSKFETRMAGCRLQRIRWWPRAGVVSRW